MSHRAREKLGSMDGMRRMETAAPHNRSDEAAACSPGRRLRNAKTPKRQIKASFLGFTCCQLSCDINLHSRTAAGMRNLATRMRPPVLVQTARAEHDFSLVKHWNDRRLSLVSNPSPRGPKAFQKLKRHPSTEHHLGNNSAIFRPCASPRGVGSQPLQQNPARLQPKSTTPFPQISTSAGLWGS